MKITEVNQEDLDKSINEYLSRDDGSLVSSFVSNIYQDDISKTVDLTTVQKWFTNPETYLNEIINLSTYYYIANPNIFQLYDLTKILPTLNYKIIGDTGSKSYKDNKNKISKIMRVVKHKTLTREVISQLIASGTLCGIWLGSKTKPFFYAFDNLKFVFPATKNEFGDWVVWVDLKWFDTMNEIQRKSMFSILSPYVTEDDYDKYKKNSEEVRYVELPHERTVCLRTHTQFINQRFGFPWATNSFFDVLHKEKLKSLEKSIANKVINSVAVLTLGNDEFTDDKIKNKKQKTFIGVRRGLEKNSSNTGITVIGIPHWSKLEFPDIKTDGLDPKKFDSLDKDINAATNGVMNVVNGTTNYSSGSMSMDILYRKIGAELEQIEQELYQKLFNLILPISQRDSYFIEYDKSKPLSTKERVSVLESLNRQFGTSLKAVIDEIEGVDYEQFLADTIHEQEVLKLPERIKPYSSAFTSSGKDNGSPQVDDVTGGSTEATKTSGGNFNPKPSTE